MSKKQKRPDVEVEAEVDISPEEFVDVLTRAVALLASTITWSNDFAATDSTTIFATADQYSRYIRTGTGIG